MFMRTNLLLLAAILLSFPTATVHAGGPQAPAGWGKPKPLPPANGKGQVSFKHGGKPYSLPLNKVEIDTKDDLVTVSLIYVDASQENKLELYFSSMPKLGKNDPRMITGFVVTTKAKGLSRSAANRSKCPLTIASLTSKAVSGSLTCSQMTDMSAQKPAPDVTDVKFAAEHN